MIVAALMTASTCGKSRMAIMASEPVARELEHDGDIEKDGQRGEDDEHEPIAALPIRVEVRHDMSLFEKRMGPCGSAVKRALTPTHAA